MEFIEHSTVVDLLGLTSLIYNYSKDFTLAENQTIENFVDNLDQTGGSSNLTEARNKALHELSEKSPHGKVIEFISDPETDLQVAITISETNQRITVTFRGSESKSDWYYDLMITKHNLHDDVWVHSGFHTQLTTNNVHTKLITKLKELIDANPSYKVFVTGHSLGAALSTLFGYMISREFSNTDITIVSFASPRVGDSGWKTHFDDTDNLTHYRISNDRDVVTAVPMIGYHHVGINIKLTDNKFEIYKKCDYPWYTYSLFNCWRASDHDCDLYYKRLLKNDWTNQNITLDFFR